MHTRSSPFVNVRRARLTASAFAGLGAFALLSACITAPFKDAKVDPRSPIAAEVPRAVHPNAPYPTFVNFPAAPKDVRPHKQYGRQAAQVELTGVALIAATADSTWALSDNEAFAAQGRADAGPELPPVDPAETAAFAKDLNSRATPPPPIKR